MPVSGSLPLGGDEDHKKGEDMNEYPEQAQTLNAVHSTAADAVAQRVVQRAPKFQKFINTVLDNAKDWTSGERSHISDGETDISADEIRTLLGGELWDRVEADVRVELEDEIRDEVRDEVIEDLDLDDLPDAVREAIEESVKEQVINDAVRALENL